MSTELDELLTRVAVVADRLALPSTAAIAVCGRRRRRLRWTVAAALILVLAGVAGALQFLPKPVEPTDMFHFDRPVTRVVTFADEQRVYAAWLQDDGRLKAGAIDLRTGKQVWPSADLGVTGQLHGVHTTGGALIVAVESAKITDSGDIPPVWRVLDAATGELRDERPLVAMWETMKEPVTLDDVIVSIDRKAGRLTAFEPLSMKVLWTAQDRLGPEKWSSAAWWDSTKLPAQTMLRQNEPLPMRADRLVQVLADGRVQIRDGRTGAVTHTNLTVPSGKVMVVDGTIYVFTETTLQAFPLGGGAPGPKYTFPESGGNPQVCGAHLVCFRTSGIPGKSDWVALRAETGVELWRRPWELVQIASITADHILMRSDGGFRVLDHTNRIRYEHASTRETSVGFLTADTLFKREWRETGSVLSTVNFISGEERHLATLDLRGGCAWLGRTVYCPTTTGFVKLAA